MGYLTQSSQLPFSAKMVSRNPPPVKVTSEREREYLRPKEVEAMLNAAHPCGRLGRYSFSLPESVQKGKLRLLREPLPEEDFE